MIRLLIAIALTTLAGCVCQPDLSYKRPQMVAPWDTTYLLDANPSAVSKNDLENHAEWVEKHYWKYAQVNGICWPPIRSDPSLEHPDSWRSGGDSAMFSGYALAAQVMRYCVQGQDFSVVIKSLEGLYLLTHVTGTPGVIARCAFPENLKEKFYYPQSWRSRIDRGFVGTGPEVTSPLRPVVVFPKQIYYTRATKDQLTGILFGLAVTWKALESEEDVPDAVRAADVRAVRRVVAEITEDIYNHLQKHDWDIRDEKGENETNSDHVSGLLRVVMLGLYRHTAVITNPGRVAKITEEYKDELESFIDFSSILVISDRFNNYTQYYGHNLRASRAYTVWILGDTADKKLIRDYFASNVWNFVEGHQNAWFAYLGAAMGSGSADEGYAALQSLSLKPLRSWSSPLKGQEIKPSLLAAALNCTQGYVRPPHLRKPTKYSTWQKEPWDVEDGPFDTKGRASATGGGYLSSYWLARYHNLIP